VCLTAIVLLYLKLLRHSFSSVQSLSRRSLADWRYMIDPGLADWPSVLLVNETVKLCDLLWVQVWGFLSVYLPYMSGQVHEKGIIFTSETLMLRHFHPFPFWSLAGNTLLEGVCIRLTWHLHNRDTCHEYEGDFVEVTVIKCHSLNYEIFNANMTLFEMSLLWHLYINHQYIITCQCLCHDNLTLLRQHSHDIAD